VKERCTTASEKANPQGSGKRGILTSDLKGSEAA